MAEEIKRTYVIPLRRGFVNTPKYKRTNKAVRVLREFLKKHMKSEHIRIGPQLNELLWVDGIKNPPGKVKVTATKDKDGVVKAELEGVAYVDFKIEEKTNKNASFKEKLQSKVAASKENKSEVKENKSQVKESKTEKVDADKEKLETETKTESKKEVKAESEDKTENKSPQKAETSPEAKENNEEKTN